MFAANSSSPNMGNAKMEIDARSAISRRSLRHVDVTDRDRLVDQDRRAHLQVRNKRCVIRSRTLALAAGKTAPLHTLHTSATLHQSGSSEADRSRRRSVG